MYVMEVKISVTIINGHLRPENTVITKELVRKLNNNLLQPVPLIDWIPLDYLNQNI